MYFRQGQCLPPRLALEDQWSVIGDWLRTPLMKILGSVSVIRTSLRESTVIGYQDTGGLLKK